MCCGSQSRAPRFHDSTVQPFNDSSPILPLACGARLHYLARVKKTFDTVEAVVADLRKGKMVIVVDDADRENEGDLILAAEHVSPATVNFMLRFGRGLICVPTTEARLKQLGIERM